MERKLIDKKYETFEQVESNSMVTVYHAKKLEDDTVVTLKIINPFLISSDPAFEKRFFTGSKLALGVDHPNLLKIIDIGKTEETFYIVMEHVEGKTLKELIGEKGSFTISEIQRILDQLASALDFLHERRLIHGCLRSESVVIDSKTGRAILMDYCIFAAATPKTLSDAGILALNPEYISPEQARGESPSVAGDIYSLGAIVYEMLVGQPPFSGYSSEDIIRKHVDEAVKPLRQINPSFPFEVENSVLRALSKNPRDRYISASNFAQSFQVETEKLSTPEEGKTEKDGSELIDRLIDRSKIAKKSSLIPLIIIIVIAVILTLAYYQYLSQKNKSNRLPSDITVAGDTLTGQSQNIPKEKSQSSQATEKSGKEKENPAFADQRQWLQENCGTCHTREKMPAFINRIKDITRNEIEYIVMDDNHRDLKYSWDDADKIGQFFQDWYLAEFDIDLDAPSYADDQLFGTDTTETEEPQSGDSETEEPQSD
jgi:serine/threonine protein kinase